MPDPILHNLHTRPKATNAYLWCDYAELRCLAHADHKFSRGALLELLEETIDIAAAEEQSEDDEEWDGEGIDAEELDEMEENPAEPGPDEILIAAPLPRQDRNEAKVADVYRNLAYRAVLFGDAYPFVLDEAQQELSLREIDAPLRKFYLQLLLSASLRLVPNTRRHELTEPFEQLSTKIFACLMPQGWEVHRFGAKGAVRYKGHLFTRLTKLAEDLRGTLSVTKQDYATTNAGDGGLDIVAWHPLGGDHRIGIPIALAQCGCTAEEWTLKTLEASPAGPLGAALNTHHIWATYYFMPQDLVAAHAEEQRWQCRPKLTKSIVIDRIRLIRLAQQYGVEDDCANASARVVEASQLAIV